MGEVLMMRVRRAVSRWLWKPRFAVHRLRGVIHASIWVRNADRIWAEHRHQDQLAQIIWRLEMNQSTPDNRVALFVARQLWNDIYGSRDTAGRTRAEVGSG